MQQLNANLLSIQVGLPATLDADNPGAKTWTSGIVKQPVSGSVALEPTNLEGDRQADLKVHGGPDKAVCVYPAEHYPHWQKTLSIPVDFSHGAFGENFTVAGIDEQSVCIGDSFQLGDVVVQVSQPRQPCWKLARRWGIKDLAQQVQKTGYTGWYFRVLRPGAVQPGMRLELAERPHDEWTIARANQVMYDRKVATPHVAELADLALLSKSWRRTLTKRLARNG